MRQLLQDDMKKNNWKCNCIRCREIKDNIVNDNEIKLDIVHYKASDGTEYFISFETTKYLIGFIKITIK
jgi:elongator complex protein 3